MVLPRFQIHLSTAIVLMFVAGGLIWANVRLRVVDPRDVGKGTWICDTGYGYPQLSLHIITEFFPDSPNRQDALKNLQVSIDRLESLGCPQCVYLEDKRGVFSYPPTRDFVLNFVAIANDIVFALAILLLTAILSEYISRRGSKRSARNP
ncbi:MAG TPA: hypothetical protein VKX17_05490 [Planctomycetota bacterium]|nr:hypothetical protein [Planctomycetota bacterium]